jgi:hypothetical protein
MRSFDGLGMLYTVEGDWNQPIHIQCAKSIWVTILDPERILL